MSIIKYMNNARKGLLHRVHRWAVVSVAAMFASIAVGLPASADVVAGVQSAKDTAIGTIKPVVNTVLVPIGCVVVVIFLVVNIIGCAQRHRAGEEFKDKLINVGICIVIIAVVASFPAWGWTMIGQ